MTPADSELEGRAAPRHGGWEHSGLPGPPRGGQLWELNGGVEASRSRKEGEERGREWEAGVSQRLGTRVVERHSQQFPMERAASPPRTRSSGSPRTSCSQASGPAPEDSLWGPGLPTFLPRTAPAPACSCALPPPPPPQERDRESSGAVGCGPAVIPDVRSWALACPRPGGREEAGFYLPGEVPAPPKAARGQWGEGGLPSPPTPLPRQALPPKMSLFTARRQDFLLLEKKSFIQGPRGTGERELAGTSPSESETHGRRFPKRSLVPSPLLSQLDPWDSNLAKPQTLGNCQNLPSACFCSVWTGWRWAALVTGWGSAPTRPGRPVCGFPQLRSHGDCPLIPLHILSPTLVP